MGEKVLQTDQRTSNGNMLFSAFVSRRVRIAPIVRIAIGCVQNAETHLTQDVNLVCDTLMFYETLQIANFLVQKKTHFSKILASYCTTSSIAIILWKLIVLKEKKKTLLLYYFIYKVFYYLFSV